MTNQLQHQQRRTLDLRTFPAIEDTAYCALLHVRPTTIFICVFKFIKALLSASLLLNTEMAVNDQINEYGNMSDIHKSTVIAADIMRRIVVASVSALGIYATISGRGSLLLPLYAVLLIDFFFTLPSFSNWDAEPSLADGLPGFKTNSVNNTARYTIMLLLTITIMVKIYFLCVIWKCYRYLRLLEIVSPFRAEIQQNISQYPIVRVLGSLDSSDLAPPPYESISSTKMRLPNYEEATRQTSMMTINPPDSASPTSVVSFNSEPSAIAASNQETNATDSNLTITNDSATTIRLSLDQGESNPNPPVEPGNPANASESKNPRDTSQGEN